MRFVCNTRPAVDFYIVTRTDKFINKKKVLKLSAGLAMPFSIIKGQPYTADICTAYNSITYLYTIIIIYIMFHIRLRRTNYIFFYYGTGKCSIIC